MEFCPIYITHKASACELGLLIQVIPIFFSHLYSINKPPAEKSISVLQSPMVKIKTLMDIMLTFSPRFFEFSFSFFLREVMNSVKMVSLSFIFSIALNRVSLACLAANSLNVVLKKKQNSIEHPRVLHKY